MAEYCSPDGAMTLVDFSPAITWALVTTRLGATKNPLPSRVLLQARPSTFTVEAMTFLTTSSVMSTLAGGVPASGDGSSGSMTDGNPLPPTRRRKVLAVSGGPGPYLLNWATNLEFRTCCDGQPGTSAAAGRTSQRTNRTPAIPAKPPAI